MSAAQHDESSRGQVEACLDDVVEVVAVIVRLARGEVGGDVDGYVDSRADGQGMFVDAEPVQDGLFGPHVADAGLGCLGVVVHDVDLESSPRRAQGLSPRRHIAAAW